MALTVGTDTYISAVDCTTYLASRYISSDTKYTTWLALSNDNKDSLLRQALDLIEKLPFAGVKVVSTQTLEFPRMLASDWAYPALGYISKYPGWYEQTAVPNDVKYAQCEIAVSLASGNARYDLQQQGVKSYTLGKLSETFAVGGSMNRIPSQKAISLLRPYLAGTVTFA